MDDLYDRVFGFIGKVGQFKVDILDRENQIKVLEDEINEIRKELNLSFDEWMNCKDEKAKDKLEWKRNKVASPINPKIYRIQGLKKEIKDIERKLVQFIKEDYVHTPNDL